ncbi:MAG: TonB-dependent receptor [Breznakiellaceae bacterium]
MRFLFPWFKKGLTGGSFVRSFLLWFLFLGGVFPFFLVGQESSPTLLVTARRSTESIDMIPGHVYVIGADEIAASGATNVVDVLKSIPAITVSGALSGPGSESISLRGFGENSFGRVLVLVDGRRLNNPDMQNINWNSISFADVERIEVLEGASSVEYGNNAVAGVINIVTKKDITKQNTRLVTSFGSFFENRVQISHQQNTEKGAFSLAAEHTGKEGYRDRQQSQVTNITLQETLYPGEQFRISFQGALSDLQYQLPGGLTKTQFQADPTQAVNWADEGKEQHLTGSLGFEWTPSEQLSVEVPLSYHSRWIFADMASWSTYISRFVQTGELRPKATAQLQIGLIPLRFVGGADVYGAFLSIDQYSDKERTNLSNAYDVSMVSAGPYLSLRLELLKNLFLSTGLRYDTAIIGAKSEDGSVNDQILHSAFVYNGSLVYRPIQSLKVYTTYGTLFRYPFTDEQAEIYTGGGSFNKNLRPEKGFTAETGVGFDLGKWLSVEGNLYYMEIQDEIAYNMSTFHNENMDRTRRWGGTVSLSSRLSQNLQIEGGYAFVDARFMEGFYKDKQVPLVSPHKVNGSVYLYLPYGITVVPSVEYRSAAFQGGDLANTKDPIEAYTVYSARLSWVFEREGSSLTFNGKISNILDTKYASLVYWDAYYPADGRSLSVWLEYKF